MGDILLVVVGFVAFPVVTVGVVGGFALFHGWRAMRAKKKAEAPKL